MSGLSESSSPRKRAREVSASSLKQALPPLSAPAAGRLHLLPFLIPTALCDADAPEVVTLARSLVKVDAGIKEKAMLIRTWIRQAIAFRLDDKKAKASETLQKREGMFTNRANLQVAMLRAVGVPAGYRLMHITKECYRTLDVLPEVFAQISEPTVND